MYSIRPPFLYKKYLPKAVWRMNPLEKKIYLTFDDGPIPEVTPWVLELLNKENVKATFFCVGANVEKHPENFRQILAEGHAVGNHSFNHLNGWKTNNTTYIDNVKQCSQVVDSKLFRPPYGKLRKSQSSILSNEYSIIMWNVLSGDFDKATSPEKCLQNATKHLKNGAIVLFHDSIKAKVNMEYALPRFITFAKQKGFEFEKL